jgi:hypothetical protein
MIMRRPNDTVYVNSHAQTREAFVICHLPSQKSLRADIKAMAVPATSFVKPDGDAKRAKSELDVTHLMFDGLVQLRAMNPKMARTFEGIGDEDLDGELCQPKLAREGVLEVICQPFLIPMADYCRASMLGAQANQTKPHDWSLARIQLLALRIAIARSDQYFEPQYLWPRALLPTRKEP